MSIVENLIEWSKQIFLPYGEFGLFLIAFMESSFFPIPPDIILIPLCLFNPSLALYFALICTIGSIIGAIAGYFIGLKGGRPVLLKIVSDHKVQKVEKYFSKYGAWAVGIAGFSPIPYKIFTITSGIMRLNFPKFLIASFLSRGGRFFLEAIVIMFWGQQLLDFMINYFEIFTIGVIVGIIGLYLVYKKIINQQK